MRAVFTMWRYVRMIVLVAVIAAIYAAIYLVLSPLSIQLIPGVLVFSLRDLFPMFFGVIFGPAAAFGLGIGNTIGDFFTGSLAIGSIFGFLTNFFVAYVGYTLWTRFGDVYAPTASSTDSSIGMQEAAGSTSSTTSTAASRVRQVVAYLIIGLIAAFVGAVVLAWGLNLLGLAPFQPVAITLFADLTIGNWIGGIFYFLIFSRIRSLGLDWTSIMSPKDIGKPLNANIGAILLIIGGVGGWVLGTFLLHGAAITPVVGIFFLAIVVGAVLL